MNINITGPTNSIDNIGEVILAAPNRIPKIVIILKCFNHSVYN